MPNDMTFPLARKRTRRAPGARDIQGQGGGKGGRSPVIAKDNLSTMHVVKLLEILCEGPVKSISAPYFDGTPLVGPDGKRNFAGVTYELRRGLPDQAPISNISEQEFERPIDAIVTKSTPVVQRISDPDTDSAKVQVRIPAMFNRNTSNGDILGTDLKYRVQYRPISATNWIEAKGSPFTLTDKKATSPVFRIHKFPLTGTGPWDVRVVRETPDTPDPTDIANDLYFFSLGECIDQKFTYRHTAVAGITAHAEQFGSSIPTRGYLVEGLICRVPTNFDPETRTYSGTWNGTFKNAWTDCPAWCLRELIRHMRWGLGQYIPVDMLTDTTLYAISQYCAEKVSDGKGGQEPRFTFNAYIATLMDAYQLLNSMVSVFRGMVYYSMGQVYFTTDGPRDPELLVTRANTVNGEFTYRGASLLTQHNRVNVTYNDPNNNYKREIATVEEPDDIMKYGLRTTDIVAFGCTSKTQALRAGRWLLYTERMESETINYVGGPDHVDVAPGSIVRVMDPSQMGASMGGRLAAVSGNRVTLDRTVTLTTGQNYEIVFTDKNRKLHYRSISFRGTTNGFTFSTALPEFPADPKESIWAIRRTTGPDTLWRVLSSAEVGPDQYEITAVRHQPSKFNIVENGLEIPDFPEPLLPTGALEVPKNLRVREYTTPSAGSNDTVNVSVSATRPADPRVRGMEIAYRRGKQTWRSVDLGADTETEITNLVSGAKYSFRVRSYDGTGRTSDWSAVLLEELSGDPVASTIPNISGVTIISGFKQITVKWTNPPIANFKNVELWTNSTNNLTTATLATRTSSERHAISGLNSDQTLHIWARVNIRGVQDRTSPYLYLGFGKTTKLVKEDLGDTALDEMKVIARDMGIKTLTSLTTPGEYADQIGMMPDGTLYRWDAVAKKWTQSLYAGIPDNFLDETKFAQGVEPNKIIPAGQPLPTTKLTTNVVWNGKLYTWDGTKYQTPSFSLTPGIVETIHIADRAVAAAKVGDAAIDAIKLANNAVTRDKIINGAVETAKLANLAASEAKIATSAITETKVGSNAITTPKILASSIIGDHIVGSTITAGKLGADSVESRHVAADAISSRNIQAKAVGADQIASRAIASSKVAISDFENMVLDDQFEDPDAWVLDPGVTINVAGTSLNATAKNVLTLSNTTVASSGRFGGPTSATNVRPGDEFIVGCRVRGSGTGARFTAYARIDFLKADGTSAGNIVKNFAPHTGTSFVDRNDTVVAPAGAVKAFFRFGRRGDFAGETNTGYIELPYVRRKNGGELIVDGAITTTKLDAEAVTAEKVKANTITGDQIAGNTITGGKIVGGSITGDKIAGNTITGGKIQAGAVGADQIAAGAILSSKMAISDWTNLITNPDFTIDNGATGSSDGWVLANQATIAESPSNQEGKWGLALPPRDSGEPQAYFNQRITVKAGDEFHYSATFRASGTTPRSDHRIGFHRYDADMNSVGSVNIATQTRTVTGPAELSGSYKIPAGVSYIRPYIARSANTAQSGTTHVTIPNLRRKNNGELIVDGAITTNKIAAGSITADSAILANLAVTSAAIGNLAVARGKIADLAVSAAKIANTTITNAQIANGTITNAKIDDLAVTSAKIADLTVGTIKIADSAVTKFFEVRNWEGVSTDNTSSSVLVCQINWTAETAHMFAARIRFGSRASSGGAQRMRVFLELDGAQMMFTDSDGDSQPTAGRYINNTATSSSHGTIFAFDMGTMWVGGGSHSLQIRFVTTGYHGTLGGEIRQIRWVK